MIPMAQPLIGDAEIEAVIAVLRSGQLVQGKVVEEFERSFAEICGVRHAIATTSGTTALHVALLAHGIGPGDEVITTSFSFVASANAALYVGATPVFADIDPDTFNIDVNDIERRITPRTRAIIPVHLYGSPADLTRLEGKPVGSFGTGCFSFYPTKNVMSGEGGMITTNDDGVAERARLLRAHGMPQRYVHESLGYNFRLSNIHAAIGLAQLDHLEEWTARRVENARTLKALLADAPIAFQQTLPGAKHVYHQFTIRVGPERDAVAAYMREHGVATEIYYPIPIHQQKLYQDRGYTDSLPVTEQAAREVLSLPVHPSLTQADLETVASTLIDALAAVRAPALAD